jgi:hypothetical protein
MIDKNEYDFIVDDIKNWDVKKLVSNFMQLCWINTWLNADWFKKELAKYITPDTEIYKELEEIIFGDNFN